MAAVSGYSTLYPAIFGRLPAVPDDKMLRQAVQWVVREFLVRTMAWRERLDAIDTTADEDEYTLTSGYATAAAGADIHQIVNVWLRSAQGVTDGVDGTLQNLANIKYTPKTGVLKLPSEISTAVADGMLVEVVYVPHFDATATSAWVLARYFDGFVAGAAEYLASQEGRRWASPRVADRQGKILSIARSRARNDVLTEMRAGIPLLEGGPCAFIGS